MTNKIKRKIKDCELEINLFRTCITDGSWLVSRIDVLHINTGKKAAYVFGTDAIEATIYEKNNPTQKLVDLAIDTLINHLEKTPDDFKIGFFRFEFDGCQFDFCEQEPRWANYDCGIID